MRITLALLADHALANQADGKLYVTGGGIQTLKFSSFPAVQPRLSLALGIEVGENELDDEHSLSADLAGPIHENSFQPVHVTFRVRSTKGSEFGYLNFVSNMENVLFSAPGEYSFDISIDAAEIEHLRLNVEPDEELVRPDHASRSEVAHRLEAGYKAFMEGDFHGAEDAFRAVTQSFSENPHGHNNLGFVLLSVGRAEESLTAFSEAKRLGYPQDEILDANIACAKYVLGDVRPALQGFEECLSDRVLQSQATLFGIESQELCTVSFKSAAEYASLVALNAAWSAHAAGDRQALERYLAEAASGELAHRGDVESDRFLRSVGTLAAVVGSSGLE